MIIKNWLLDIRDYAFILEYKQTGDAAKKDYISKVLPMFGVYYTVLMGAILYLIRAFYDVPLIKQIYHSGLFVKVGFALLFVYLPFRILHFFLDRKFADIPFPNSQTPPLVLKRKKKVYWLTFVSGIVLFVLLIVITLKIGYVGDGPIF